MPISSSGAEARIAADDPRDDPRALSRRAAVGPVVARRREELSEQISVRGMQLDHLKSRLPGIHRRGAESLDHGIDVVVVQDARAGRLPWRANGGGSDRGEPHLRAGRLATQVDELAAGDRALGADRLRAQRHPGHSLLAPRLADHPSPPRGLGRRHRAADDQHRRATGRPTPPILGIGGLRQTVRDKSGSVGGSHEPVTQDELGRRARTARPRDGPRRSSSSVGRSAASDEREVAGRVELRLAPKEFQHELRDLPAIGVSRRSSLW